MRNEVTVSRFGRLGPVTFVVLLAGFSAACSDSIRLREPLFTGSTDNQRNIIGNEPTQAMPPALVAGTQPVNRAPLPPPPLLASNQTESAPPTGPFTWTAIGGTVLTVAPGQTLADLAVKFGVPAEQILTANQLTRASQITGGRVIVIPRRVAISPESVRKPTPVVASAPRKLPPIQPAPAVQAAPIATASAGYHVVRNGDTLYSIARRYGARVDDLARINGLASASQIRIGQRLALTGNVQSNAATSAFAVAKHVSGKLQPTLVSTATSNVKPRATTTVAAAPKVQAAPTIPVQTTSQPPTTTAAIDSAADPASANGITFRWPVRGRIISGFGSKTAGDRNDGINLAVPEGTSVKATEAGTVIYAGNELEGYGNLILIRHTDGWVSAYAHNKQLKVARGDKIRRGQTVALAGRTGSVSTPQVHFELRRGAKPVNPLDYLSGA